MCSNKGNAWIQLNHEESWQNIFEIEHALFVLNNRHWEILILTYFDSLLSDFNYFFTE